MAGNNTIDMERKRRLLLIGAGVLILLVLIALTVFMLRDPDTPNPSVVVTKPHSEDISGQAGGKGSEEYNRKLQKHDDEKAAEALKAGESFVPTPIGNKRPAVGKKDNAPPPPPKVAPVKTAPIRVAQTDNTLLKRMLEDLAALDAKLSSVSVGNSKIEYEKDFSKEVQQVAMEEAKPQPVSAQAQKPTSDLKPGDLLYAIIDTGVNSDVPSAVMASVAQGKYRNSRLIGSFQRHDERMVLAFSRLIQPDGHNLKIEAYAVDPSTSEASVASSVDTHFFSRWGGLIASAFLEGLGTAKRYSGASSTVYGYGNNTSDQMVWNNYSPEDQAWIAAGKVGEKASKIFEKNFDRPPTVYLESGSPVGILILNVEDK